MRTIHEIEHVERLKDKDNVPYFRTHAVLDDGGTAVGFSRSSHEFDLEDKVEVFFDPKHNMIKMRHSKNEPTRIELESV